MHNKDCQITRNSPILASVLLGAAIAFSAILAHAGARLIIQLKDFSRTETKSGGFVLLKETKLHLSGLGAGGDSQGDRKSVV